MKYGKMRTGDEYGPGSMSKNPNTEPSVNDSPDGPFSHMLGYTGDGGMHGSTEVKEKGKTFHIR